MSLGDGVGEKDLLAHDPRDFETAQRLVRWQAPELMGIFYQRDAPTYERMLQEQVDDAVASGGEATLEDLLTAGETYEIGR